jgi:hypothetical protein
VRLDELIADPLAKSPILMRGPLRGFLCGCDLIHGRRVCHFSRVLFSRLFSCKP